MAHEYVYWNGGHTDGGYADESYTTHNGMGPRMNSWNKGAGNGHADHVCRPVIVDALGRKRPIVCFNPGSNTEMYVTKTETVVEHVLTPAATEYKYGSPGKVLDEQKYGYPARVEVYKHSPPGRVVDEHKPSHPVRVEVYRHSSPGRVVDEHKPSHPVRVEVYRHSSPGRVVDEHKPSHPVRVEVYRHSSPGRVVDEHKPSHPVRVEVYRHSSPGRVVDEHKPPSHPVRVEEYKHSPPGRVVDEHKYSYPVRVEEYNHSSPGKVVDEHKHSHPVRMEEYKHSSPDNRWGRPSSPVHDRPPIVEEFITKIQTKVSDIPTRPAPLTALNWRQPRNFPKAPNGTGGYGEYSDYSKDDYWNKPSGNIISRSDSFDDDYYRRNGGTKEPTITDSNGWGRANHAEWATPPGSNLTRATSDIGAAVEILKEAAMPSSGQYGRFATPASTVPKYKGTIDSTEAKMRYGNLKPTPRPYSTGAPTIDSKTAEEKYKGAKVP